MDIDEMAKKRELSDDVDADYIVSRKVAKYVTRKCYEAASRELSDSGFQFLINAFILWTLFGIGFLGFYIGSIGGIHLERMSVEC
jgi:hypothetical protein